MDYTDRIKYSIYKTYVATNIGEMLDDLIGQIPTDLTPLRIVIFGSPNSNAEYNKHLNIIKTRLAYHNIESRISYVAQQPLDCTLAMELHSYDLSPTDTIVFGQYRTIGYSLLSTNEGQFLFASALRPDANGVSRQQQAEIIFGMMEDFLSQMQFPLNSIVRQWNYVEDITGFEGGNQHYQILNDARSQCYDTTTWTDGYPSATGIGTAVGGYSIDFDAVMLSDEQTKIHPIDNLLQVSAHKYSKQVLVAADQSKQKSTPKFERAKAIAGPNGGMIYISGTAAIKGENSCNAPDVGEQLTITLEHIKHLIAQGAGDNGKPNIETLRVYLKNPKDTDRISEALKSLGLLVPTLYLCADVCRDELLLEIEGIIKY